MKIKLLFRLAESGSAGEGDKESNFPPTGGYRASLLRGSLFFIIFINFFLVLPFLNSARAILEEGCSQESFKQQKADRVVIGTVSATNCSEKVCLTTILVEKNLKGEGKSEILIETLWLGENVWIEDSPTFEKGEKAKFYLKSTVKPDTYTLVCSELGKVLPGEEIPEPKEITDKSIPVFESIKSFFTAIINQLKQIFKFKKALPDKSKYCVDYLGNPEPEGPCSTVGIEARKCKNIGDCRATCAFGCMNKNEGMSGRADCTAEPQYECECINNFCQIKAPLTWEECTQNPKSKIQPTYPSVCVYPDGRTVIEEPEPQSETPEILPEKITFNNLFYVPAKCFLPASVKVKRIGISEEGLDIYTTEEEKPPNIPDSEKGILLKRSDGQYQCYTQSNTDNNTSGE